MASKIFNGTTVSGRANVAKATYASIAVLYLYYRIKNRGKGSAPPPPPPTKSPEPPSASAGSNGSNRADRPCPPDPRCAGDQSPDESNGSAITGTAAAAAAADAYINSTSNTEPIQKASRC